MPQADSPRHPRRRSLLLAAVIAVLVGATACMPPLIDPPTSGRNFGEGPLEAVYDAATAKAACGLSAVQLSAMMMAPTRVRALEPTAGPTLLATSLAPMFIAM